MFSFSCVLRRSLQGMNSIGEFSRPLKVHLCPQESTLNGLYVFLDRKHCLSSVDDENWYGSLFVRLTFLNTGVYQNSWLAC